jgi:hypothetical protein
MGGLEGNAMTIVLYMGSSSDVVQKTAKENLKINLRTESLFE